MIGDGFENGNGGLGYSVALSADGNTALVGTPFDSSSAGAAFIFARASSSADGSQWVFRTREPRAELR